MAVKENLLQGGGLVPVVGGEDHLPEEGEVTHVLILPASSIKYQVSFTAIIVYSNVARIFHHV